MARRARHEDVDEVCASLPEAWFGTSWGDVPTWLVPSKVSERGKGKGFVLYRKPSGTAIDPATEEPYDDLLVIRTPDAETKTALVASEGPFFTVAHFEGYNAVLVQLSRLGEITRDELDEVITDAWRFCMPPGLLKRHEG